jgi:toxin HigB-1
MKIRNVVYKGLRRLMDKDDRSALPAAAVEKIRNILSFLQDMESAAELRDLATWKVHRLGGDRKGTWSLSVSRNWRITFRINEREREREREIVDLDYEDYH